MSLTKKQIKDYLKKPCHCPYCKSEDITYGDIDADGDTMSAKSSCNDCEKEWLDVYKLSFIEEI